MNLATALDIYIDSLQPELDETALETETISRLAYRRQVIENAWDEVDERDRPIVAEADQVLIANAETVAPWWATEVRRRRAEVNPPLAAWWWWLDKIADGDYPSDLLPEVGDE